jgi:hypothetical protein
MNYILVKMAENRFLWMGLKFLYPTDFDFVIMAYMNCLRPTSGELTRKVKHLVSVINL